MTEKTDHLMETRQAPRDLIDTVQEYYLLKDYIRVFEITPKLIKRIVRLEREIEMMSRQFESIGQ